MTVDCSCEGCEAQELCGLSESVSESSAEDEAMEAAGSTGCGERASGSAFLLRASAVRASSTALGLASVRPGLAASAAQALAVPSSAPAEKLVDVWTDHAAAFAPGEEVVVSVVRVMSVNAVVWAYIVPLFIMLVILVGGKLLGFGDLGTGGSALGAGALYYAGLWLLRRRLKRIPIFRLGKL